MRQSKRSTNRQIFFAVSHNIIAGEKKIKTTHFTTNIIIVLFEMYRLR